MMHTTKLRYLWLILGWGLIGLIIYLSLAPRPPQPGIVIPFGDKIGHALAYFTVMTWFAQIYPTGQQRRYLVIGFILLGGLLEILQGWGGVRVMDLWDFSANTCGVLSSWFIVTFTPLGSVFTTFEKMMDK